VAVKHAYATNSTERRNVLTVLVVLAVAGAYLVHGIVEWANIPSLWWIEIPSVPGIFGLLYGLFDQKLWRWRWLRLVGVINVPDFSGSWKGTVESAIEEYGREPREVTVRVVQTWTHLEITLESADSRSASVAAMIVCGGAAGPIISYDYLNEPKVDAPDGLYAHRGAATLTAVLDEPPRLEGEYFSGRGRQGLGRIGLTRA
jgi:hypothetical protein